MIHVYQHSLSPDHGPLKSLFPYGVCKHKVTCSEYGKKVLIQYGALLGTALTIKRILSCNPFTKISEEKVLDMLHRK